MMTFMIGLPRFSQWGASTMSCNPELVSAFLDGELDEIILGAVIKHLLGCDHCRQILSKLAQVRDTLVEHFNLPDPEATTASVMSLIHHDSATSMPTSIPLSLRDQLLKYGIPVALTSAVLIGWLYQQQAANSRQESEAWHTTTGKRSVAGITVDQLPQQSPVPALGDRGAAGTTPTKEQSP